MAVEMTNVRGQNFIPVRPKKEKPICCRLCGWPMVRVPSGYVCYCGFEYKMQKEGEKG